MQTQVTLNDQRIRRLARREGYVLRKSRARNWTYDNQLEYMVVDPSMNICVIGQRFDDTLEDVADKTIKRPGPMIAPGSVLQVRRQI